VAELREWKFAVEEDWEQRGCSGVTQECSALLADYYDTRGGFILLGSTGEDAESKTT